MEAIVIKGQKIEPTEVTRDDFEKQIAAKGITLKDYVLLELAFNALPRDISTSMRDEAFDEITNCADEDTMNALAGLLMQAVNSQKDTLLRFLGKGLAE